MSQQIEQAELAAIMDLRKTTEVIMRSIADRIRAGAQIQSGRYTAEENECSPMSQMVGVDAYGLCVMDKGISSEANNPEDFDFIPAERDDRENLYNLTMWIDGMNEQDFEISRDEFIALKKHLAQLRGIEVRNAA